MDVGGSDDRFWHSKHFLYVVLVMSVLVGITALGGLLYFFTGFGSEAVAGQAFYQQIVSSQDQLIGSSEEQLVSVDQVGSVSDFTVGETISSCGTIIDDPGLYNVDSSISRCLYRPLVQIESDGVVLNCRHAADELIQGRDTNSMIEINVDSENIDYENKEGIVIRNCNVYDFASLVQVDHYSSSTPLEVQNSFIGDGGTMVIIGAFITSRLDEVVLDNVYTYRTDLLSTGAAPEIVTVSNSYISGGDDSGNSPAIHIYGDEKLTLSNVFLEESDRITTGVDELSYSNVDIRERTHNGFSFPLTCDSDVDSCDISLRDVSICGDIDFSVADEVSLSYNSLYLEASNQDYFRDSSGVLDLRVSSCSSFDDSTLLDHEDFSFVSEAMAGGDYSGSASISSCLDTDGGYDLSVVGSVIGTSYFDTSVEITGTMWTDYCQDENTVIEYWCPTSADGVTFTHSDGSVVDVSGYAYGAAYSCSSGEICSEGVCVEDVPIEINSCEYLIGTSGTYVLNDNLEDCDWGIEIQETSDVILDCQDNEIGAESEGQGIGIIVDDSSNVEILNCDVRSFGQNIELFQASDVLVSGVYSFDAVSGGMTGTNGEGLYVYNSENVDVVDSEFDSNYYGIYILDAGPITIENTVTSNNGLVGIATIGTTDVYTDTSIYIDTVTSCDNVGGDFYCTGPSTIVSASGVSSIMDSYTCPHWENIADSVSSCPISGSDGGDSGEGTTDDGSHEGADGSAPVAQTEEVIEIVTEIELSCTLPYGDLDGSGSVDTWDLDTLLYVLQAVGDSSCGGDGEVVCDYSAAGYYVCDNSANNYVDTSLGSSFVCSSLNCVEHYGDIDGSGSVDTWDLDTLLYVLQAVGDSSCGGSGQAACDYSTAGYYVCDNGENNIIDSSIVSGYVCG